MKNTFFLLFLGFQAFANAQLITGEQLTLMIDEGQDKCIGAHESVVITTNEASAKAVWGQQVRINDANIIKFITRPSGEKVSPGFDIYANNKGKLGYEYDPSSIENLLSTHGVRVSQSYNQPWINARQNILYAEKIKEGNKIILELYCPYQEFMEVLRIGKTQSIEFLITGMSGSPNTNSKIYGVLTKVNTEKQTIQCTNGHEYDKNTGYKFCPECGEPLE